jgi:hypothetical protein
LPKKKHLLPHARKIVQQQMFTAGHSNNYRLEQITQISSETWANMQAVFFARLFAFQQPAQ